MGYHFFFLSYEYVITQFCVFFLISHFSCKKYFFFKEKKMKKEEEKKEKNDTLDQSAMHNCLKCNVMDNLGSC